MGFLPFNKDFFQYFDKMADILTQVGQHFVLLCQQFPSSLPAETKFLRELENEADRVTHETIDALNKTFITPIDREDIHALISKVDDVIDMAEDAASNLMVYNLKQPTDFLIKFSLFFEKMANSLSQTLKELRHLKNQRRLMDFLIEINSLENQGDILFKEAMANLFEKNGGNAANLVAWKDIYETLENASDRAEDVANIIESILVKQQ